jgi:single-strand DNA-binding protein
MSIQNSVRLIGRIGKDPESKQLQSGTTVCNISLATDEGYKDKQTGNWVDQTEWHSLEAWGKTAEYIANNIRKGDLLAVEGSLKTDSWEHEGKAQYRTKVKVDSVRRIQKSEASQNATQQPQNQPQPQTNFQTPDPAPATVPDASQEDDLPF